ncbi:MAG: hypothetical protein JWQ04_604 [Pedosphaera sp.]|nr:hypothetical protein [Pedosphaera sp.]
MQTDETAIIEYISRWPDTFISGREIARKVGSRARFLENPGWAVPILAQMLQTRLIEADSRGHYRMKQEKPEKKERVEKHVSPQILKILKSSGKSFADLATDGDDEPPVYRKPSSPPAQKG